MTHGLDAPPGLAARVGSGPCATPTSPTSTCGCSASTPTCRCRRTPIPGDAGADLVTAVDVTLAPGERALVPTGVALALPDGYVALVHPRSGLAARHGLSIVNTPGTIDAGYRGEIKVLLVNHDLRRAVELRRGDRIAQLVVQRFERAALRRGPRTARLGARRRGIRFYRRLRPPSTDRRGRRRHVAPEGRP